MARKLNTAWKWIISISIIFVAVLLAAPWWVGLRAETLIRDFIAKGAAGLPVQLGVQSYQRGWFASTAEVAVAAGPAHYRLQARIAHGPLPIAAPGFSASWNPAALYIQGELKPRQAEWPLHIASQFTLGLDGDLAGHFRLAPGVLRTLEYAIFWDGALLRYRRSQSGRHLEADATALGAGGRWNGAGIRLQAVHLVTETQGDRLTADVWANVQSLHALGVRAESGAVALHARNLNGDSLWRIARYLARMEGENMGLRQWAGALAGVFLAEAPKLLKFRPRITLEQAVFDTGAGPIRAQGYAALDNTDLVVLGNPYLLSRAVDAHLQALVPEPAAVALTVAWLHRVERRAPADPASHARAWLAEQVREGDLQRRDGAYFIEIRYTDGRLYVNEHLRTDW